MSTTVKDLADSTRAHAQRNTLGVLFASAIFGRGAMTLGFAVASLLIKDMLDGATWAGLSTVAITLGTAVSATMLSQFMNRRGRRPGLVVGYATAIVGGGISLYGAQVSSIPVFLFGLLLTGVGAGASNLARYAAADLAEPEARGKAISMVVFASTIGAVAGPTVVGVADSWGQSLGLNENVGPYGFTAAFFAIAAVIVFVRLRPDPLVLAGGLHTATSPQRKGFYDSLLIILATPRSRLALGALVTAQAVMVGVMAMTPVHMDAHGHSVGTIGWVISAHTAGMFAFAPVAGWASDRFGKIRAIAFGGAVLVLACVMTSLASEAPKLLMFPGLYLLGLGWSFGMVAGSALLTESVPVDDRVSAQGAADLIASVVSGSAALASGLVLTMAGFHILSTIGIVAAGLLLVAGFARDRQESLALA
ncbi:MAG: MFS transporter [Actinomycetia bacterium]|nr:MFS transporter [Actinomycetes bacterium]